MNKTTITRDEQSGANTPAQLMTWCDSRARLMNGKLWPAIPLSFRIMKYLAWILMVAALAGCAAPKPQPAKIVRLAGLHGLPPRPPETPPKLPAKRMVYRTGRTNNTLQVLSVMAPAFGWSYRTHVTNYSAGLKPLGGFRPASVGSCADHGPVYSTTNNIPYPVVFVGADYVLLAGHTYYFEATEDFVNWYAVHDPYVAQADEMYGSFINESVNGYHYRRLFQRARVTP